MTNTGHMQGGAVANPAPAAAAAPSAMDRQYVNRLSIADAPQYNMRAESRSRAAREELRCVLDLPYGTSPRERIDIFPAAQAGAPIFCFIHGGYWRSRDKAEFSFVARPLVEAGVCVALPTYDLAPAVSIEKIVQQMLAALAWLYRNARSHGADPRRIYLGGHSAGAHLAALMVAAQWDVYAGDLPADLVKGALAVSGVYDLAPLLQVSFNSDLRLDAAAAHKLSPLTYRPLRATPLFTAVGGDESDEFKRQNQAIAKAWPHCWQRDIAMPGHHHLSILEAMGDADSPLARAALDLIGPI